LGVTGALFQAGTQRRHDEDVSREESERGYLAEFETLTELEIALHGTRSSVPDVPYRPTQTPTRDEIGRFAAITARLRYAAYALYFPDREPMVTVRDPTGANFAGRGPSTIKVPLRGAILMLADLLSGQLARAGMPDEAMVDVSGEQIVIRTETTGVTWPISRDELHGWRALVRAQTLTSGDLQHFQFRPFIDDLMQGVAQTIHEVIASKPRLADRYVTIRRELQNSALKRPTTSEPVGDLK